MTLPISVRPRAEADLDDAYGWYEARDRGLGDEFLRAVTACFARIERHPEAYPQRHPRVHRAPLHRFPYGVFYLIRDDRIDVLAVYHARRRPRRFAR